MFDFQKHADKVWSPFGMRDVVRNIPLIEDAIKKVIYHAFVKNKTATAMTYRRDKIKMDVHLEQADTRQQLVAFYVDGQYFQGRVILEFVNDDVVLPHWADSKNLAVALEIVEIIALRLKEGQYEYLTRYPV